MKKPRRKPIEPLFPTIPPISDPVLVVPPPPDAVVPGAEVDPAKEGGSKRPVVRQQHPDARDTSGKATRNEIRREVTRRVPSRLSPQQARHVGVAPGSRAAKPKRATKKGKA